MSLALASNPGGATLGGTDTATASDGVATFTGVTISATGVGDTLKASATGVGTGLSAAFTVVDELVVTTEPPADVTAGAAFGLVVKAENADGGVNTSFDGSVTVSEGYLGELGGTTTVNAVNGVATFSGLSITDVYDSDELEVSASGLEGANTTYVNVNAAPASQLITSLSYDDLFLTNASFSVTVYSEDPYSNSATTYTGSVTLALASNPGGAKLSGTATVNAVKGVATFTGVSVSAPGVGYTLKATATGLTAGVSPTFTVEDELAVTTEPPASVTAGAAFSFAASVEDGLGNVVTSYNGPVTVTDAYGYTLLGTTTVDAVNGVATFSGLTLSTETSYDELYVSASGIREAYTNNFSVAAAGATHLAVGSLYGPFLVGSSISITVDAEDAHGNLATTYTGSVTLALANNPGGATLGGTTTVNAVKGVATFTGVTVSAPGVGDTLKATATGLTAGVSLAFTVEDKLAVTTEPPASVTAGAAFNFAASVEDGLGNVVTSYNGPVTVSDAYGYTLLGTTTVDAVKGVVTFSGLKLTEAINFDELDVNASGLKGAYTTYVNVNAAPASRADHLPLRLQLVPDQRAVRRHGLRRGSVRQLRHDL